MIDRPSAFIYFFLDSGEVRNYHPGTDWRWSICNDAHVVDDIRLEVPLKCGSPSLAEVKDLSSHLARARAFFDVLYGPRPPFGLDSVPGIHTPQLEGPPPEGEDEG